MYNIVKYTFALITVAFVLTNCETEITVDLPPAEDKIVVEGSIESGDVPTVFLSKNFPYFGTFDFEALQQNFVSGATVTVSDGTTTADLDEICWSYLSPFEQQLFAEAAGISLEDIPDNFEFCLYSFFDFPPPIVGEYGKTYTLEVTTQDGKELYAETTLPMPIPLDSVWYEPHNNPEADTLWRLYVGVNDPDTLGNYYRYYTQRNDEPEYPGLNSVFDDLFVNGTSFPSPLDRGQPLGEEFNPDTYGYFKTNDTITLRWATIDRGTYTFWADAERLANSAGPFSNTTQVNFNIEGGIGIWGGYSFSTEETIIITE